MPDVYRCEILFVSDFTAQCQMQRMMMRSTIRSMITDMMVRIEVNRAVSFIVGETAKPIPEMIQFATALGRAPKSQAERDVYLELMKKTARRTQAVLEKYINIEFVNGLPKISVDYIGMDAAVARRALMYNEANRANILRRKQQQDKQRKHQEELDRIRKMHELNIHAVVSAVAPDMAASLPSLTAANNGQAYNVNPGMNQGMSQAATDQMNVKLMEGFM